MPILKRLHAAYPGQHISKAGESVGLTPEDIKELAESYSPQCHQCKLGVDNLDTAISLGAPAVLGHFDPRTVEAKGAMPAFGSVLKAYAEDNNLYLDVSLTDSMANWLDQGLYDRVSLSWYREDDRNNPTPGKKHIRHIGFHGSQPVSLKNLSLPNVDFLEFSEMTIDYEDVEFAEVDGSKARGALITLLEDGPKGYKGEITGFDPEPTEENGYLWDDEEERFAGKFIDSSGYEEEVYEFTLQLEADGSMTRSYRKISQDGEDMEFSEESSVTLTLDEYEELKRQAAAATEALELGESQVTMTQAEYDMLTQKASQADYLMEMEKQRELEARIQQIVGYLIPLQNVGLIRQDAELARIAQYIAFVGGDPMEDMGALEFSEGSADTPAAVVSGLLAELAANAANLVKVEKEVPVEYGELPIGSVEQPSRFTAPAGVGVDLEQAKLHSKVIEFCESKGLNPKNNKDYMAGLREVISNV